MYCCNTSNESIDCQITIPDIISSGTRCRAATIMAYIGKIVTPEPTDMPQAYPGLYESRIHGAVKVLFWVAVSIGIGIALATVCN